MKTKASIKKATRNEKSAEIRKPTDDELAVRWIEEHPHNVYGLECFRIYEKGVWIGRPTKDVEKEILDFLEAAKDEGIRPNISKVHSVEGLIKIKKNIPDSKWNNLSTCLAFQNGLLELSSLGWIDHAPENYITSTLPYTYDPEAKCANWLRALSSLPKDVVDFLQEFAGYSLTSDTHHEIAIWLYGPSGCGKSTIIAGFTAMLCQKSISLGLRDIEISRFNLSQIDGKTLMVSTEQPSFHLSILDIINRIISGEDVFVDDKYGTPHQITPHVKILWAMTELPIINSATDGIFRRVRIIEMPTLPEESRDLSFKEHIEQEGPGILNWAIEGLIRLLKRGRFLKPESVRLASENYKQNNDLAKQFVNEYCEISKYYQIQAQLLYNGYRLWCENSGQMPMSMNKMADEWERLGFTRSYKNHKRYWNGIKLKEATEIQIDDTKERIINSINGQASPVSPVSPTIPGEWYISETDNDQGDQHG